jgi:hypothetical protein
MAHPAEGVWYTLDDRSGTVMGDRKKLCSKLKLIVDQFRLNLFDLVQTILALLLQFKHYRHFGRINLGESGSRGSYHVIPSKGT